MYLVNRFLIVSILLYTIISAEYENNNCFDLWYTSNIDLDTNNIIKYTFDIEFNESLQSGINNQLDSVILYVDLIKSNIRLDYNNQIIIFDTIKTTTLFKETNQLFIENKNIELSNFSDNFKINFINHNYIYNQDYNYYLTNSFLEGFDARFYFDLECKIDYLEIDKFVQEKKNAFIKITNVLLDYEVITEDYNPFEIQGNYFVFDLRDE